MITKLELRELNGVAISHTLPLSYYEKALLNALALATNYHIRSHLELFQNDDAENYVTTMWIEGLNTLDFMKINQLESIQKFMQSAKLKDFQNVFNMPEFLVKFDVQEFQDQKVIVKDGVVSIQLKHLQTSATNLDLKNLWSSILTAPDAEFLKASCDPVVNKALTAFLSYSETFQYQHINYFLEKTFKKLNWYNFKGLSWCLFKDNRVLEINPVWLETLAVMGMPKAVYARLETNSHIENTKSRQPIIPVKGLDNDEQIFKSLLKKSGLSAFYDLPKVA